MKRIGKIMLIIACIIAGLNIKTEAQKVYYTGNGGDWNNFDLYSFDIGTSTETRLTFNGAIDNHPEISHVDPTKVVFSSNRGNGEFDIYVANTANVDGTAVRLTFDAYPGGPPGPRKYPDRHPHWHPNGDLIVFTAKNRGVFGPVLRASECSVPLIIMEWRYFEGMNVIKSDGTGFTPLDVRTAWDPITFPSIWVTTEKTYVGHPSFNNEGNLMVFTAAIDGEGKNWEVYTCGFDPVSRSLIPNSLRRKTFGPNNGNNPIKLTGGAKFSNDDTQILFSSTRTTSGNSQIYSIPTTAIDWPVTMATRLTFHQGNDYVPQPVPGSDAIVFTSDWGPAPICGCELGWGPTNDLDVVLLQGGIRTILGTDASQETVLLGDEVSWLCGTKPNLSACTFTPRIMNVEALWLEHTAYDNLPDDLLAGYGAPYLSGAKQLYSVGWNFLQQNMQTLVPTMFIQLLNDIAALQSLFPVTGWTDLPALKSWYFSTEELRNKKYVVPSAMYYDLGLAGNPNKFPPYDNYLANIIVPEYCSVCHDGLLSVVTGGNGSYFTMQPGGNVDLVAGIRIQLLPGTNLQVVDGTMFHAVINPMPFCPGSISPAAPSAQVQANTNLNDKISENKILFKIYPNPATQSFWVEMVEEESPGNIQIEVFDLTGLKLLHQNWMIDKRIQISLPDRQPGIYFVRLTKGNQTGDQIVVLN